MNIQHCGLTSSSKLTSNTIINIANIPILFFQGLSLPIGLGFFKEIKPANPAGARGRPAGSGAGSGAAFAAPSGTSNPARMPGRPRTRRARIHPGRGSVPRLQPLSGGGGWSRPAPRSRGCLLPCSRSDLPAGAGAASSRDAGPCGPGPAPGTTRGDARVILLTLAPKKTRPAPPAPAPARGCGGSSRPCPARILPPAPQQPRVQSRLAPGCSRARPQGGAGAAGGAAPGGGGEGGRCGEEPSPASSRTLINGALGPAPFKEAREAQRAAGPYPGCDTGMPFLATSSVPAPRSRPAARAPPRPPQPLLRGASARSTLRAAWRPSPHPRRPRPINERLPRQLNETVLCL